METQPTPNSHVLPPLLFGQKTANLRNFIIPNVEIASEVDTDADVPQLVHTADISPVKDFCVQTTHLHRTLSKHRTALNKSGINPKFTRV